MPDDLLPSLKRGFDRILPAAWRGDVPVVPVVRLSGAIGMNTPFRQSLTLASIAKPLEKAFGVKKAPAVALIINSPGGSPVQSHLIYKRIRALAAETDKHVFAFVEDVAASGGYMLACAADEIVCDPSSVVGSIGVISAGFGFEKLIEKIGVERRVHTAGTRKMMLDPFRPERPEDVERLEAIQKEVHATFAALVKGRRGDTLSGEEDLLFSGEFWVGTQALGFGLVDDLGDLRTVLRARYGDKVRTPLVSTGSWWSRRQGGATISALQGAGLAEGLLASTEERALWARYGL
ncbi:S49 family peptidase [Aquabacter sp. CN5-332]|uniref:S49 family peptidase n=1 Tax=Aquabacter sp. CN5-332 TaxID=3156608 RepID=UPI0032B58C6A